MEAMGITSQTSFFSSDCQNEGIIGMAFESLSTGQMPVMMDVLASNGVPNGFALQLCAGLSGSSTSSKTGNLWVGGWDSSFTSGPMQYVSIVHQEWYNVQVNSISIGGTALTMNSDLNVPQSIVDSGTTQLLLNTYENYEVVMTALMASDAITISSQATSSDISGFWKGTILLPTSWCTINENFKMTVDMLAPDGSSTTSILIPVSNLFPMVTESGSTYYYFPNPIGYASESWEGTIVGETVFLNYVVFFDRTTAGSRIGFAPGKNCFSTTTVDGIDNYPVGTVVPTSAPTTPPPSSSTPSSSTPSSSTPTDSSANSGSPTGGASAPSSNAGGIAAGVIVAILVLLAVGGALFYFLVYRKRNQGGDAKFSFTGVFASFSKPSATSSNPPSSTPVPAIPKPTAVPPPTPSSMPPAVPPANNYAPSSHNNTNNYNYNVAANPVNTGYSPARVPPKPTTMPPPPRQYSPASPAPPSLPSKQLPTPPPKQLPATPPHKPAGLPNLPPKPAPKPNNSGN